MASDNYQQLSSQYKAAVAERNAAFSARQKALAAGEAEAKSKGLTDTQISAYARQTPAYQIAQGEYQLARDNAADLAEQTKAARSVSLPPRTVIETPFEDPDGSTGVIKSRVSSEGAAIPVVRVESTEGDKIPFISDETYLDPLYEPVPTNSELADIQEQLNTDAEFAAIDEQFARVDAINDPTIVTAEEENYITSGQEFEDFQGDEIVQPPISLKDARAQSHPIADTDWRFRVQLSPFSDYLYNDPSVSAGHVLSPLKETDGVIFPYTPSISVTQVANYQEFSPTHSNMKSYYYTGSAHEDLVVNAEFTAQDTDEANYMLAVMTFFKAATKMFYGQDQQRGTPPPLLYLNGFGEYAFSEHPVVLSRFAYNLPDNIDYISTATTGQTPEFVGKSQAGNSGASWSSKITRLLLSSLESGAPPLLNNNSNIDLAGMTKVSGVSTYVPTKIRFDLVFKPVTTRQMQSEEFSVKDFASGKLIKKGYW
jgi:multidrug efflux pump subunit AcrA (membrane-fusion protein)